MHVGFCILFVCLGRSLDICIAGHFDVVSCLVRSLALLTFGLGQLLLWFCVCLAGILILRSSLGVGLLRCGTMRVVEFSSVVQVLSRLGLHYVFC
jgi:hypothetical protein